METELLQTAKSKSYRRNSVVAYKMTLSDLHHDFNEMQFSNVEHLETNSGNRQAVHELSIGTAHLTIWAMTLPSSRNWQFHRLGVTYVAAPFAAQYKASRVKSS